MLTTNFLLALSIGLLVTCAVYIGLQKAFGVENLALRRAIAIFAAVAGIMVTLFVREHPDLLRQQSAKIVLALIGVALALIAFIKRKLE
jgi:drug/metabolite transporter (DMT)-like permease